MTIAETIEFIRRHHGQRLDLAGYPYWLHPVRTMLRMGPDITLDEAYAALLHDVVDENDVTLKDLKDTGFSPGCLRILTVISRVSEADRSMPYPDWIRGIIASGNESAMLVKYAEITDNLAPGRQTPLTVELEAKYRQAKGLIEGHFKALGRRVEIMDADITARPIISALQVLGVTTTEKELLLPVIPRAA